MRNNFQSSVWNLWSGRLWTLLTPAFSHERPWHFALNMIAFASFASPVLQVLGVARFWMLYLGAGVAGSLAHLTFNIVKKRDVPSLGGLAQFPTSSHLFSHDISPFCLFVFLQLLALFWVLQYATLPFFRGHT